MRARGLVVGLATLALVGLAACSSSGSAAGSAAGSPAGSAAGTRSGIAVSGAWARPAAKDGTSAAYFTIVNGGATADRLLSVSTPAAMSAQVHETATDASGMSGMHPVAGIDVPAGGQVTLKPGGYHVMLMELAKPLAVGDTIQLTLVFEKAGQVPVTAEVRQG